MNAVLGLDMAWTEFHPTGVALVREATEGWVCVALAPSYASFLQLANGVPVDWSAAPVGCAPAVPHLLAAAQRLLVDHAVTVVAADMPLSLERITGRRVADQSISRQFGAQKCGTHSPNGQRPGPLGAGFSAAFSAAGYPLGTVLAGVPQRLIEVYPHPALLRLLQAPMRVPYKVGKSRTYWPLLPLQARRENLRDGLTSILAALTREISGIPLVVPTVQKCTTTAALKRVKVSLDALVCAWVGMKYLRHEAVPYGDASAAIWVPADHPEQAANPFPSPARSSPITRREATAAKRLLPVGIPSGSTGRGKLE